MKEKFTGWWNEECKTFSSLSDDEDTFTNGEVILTYLCVMVMLLILGMVGQS